MSTPSDPQRGGQQPDSTADAGPERAVEPADGGDQRAPYPPPGQPGGPPYAGGPGQYPPNQYGQYPQYPQNQYGQGAPDNQYNQYNPYAQGGYGQQPGYGPPAGYTNQPYAPYGNQPYATPDGKDAYAYSPYGTPQPYLGGDDGTESAPRPGILAGALILLILSALPFLAVGALMVFVVGPEVLPPEILNDPRLAEAGVTQDLLVSALRVAGGVMAGLALLYVIFAVLAFGGHNWARVLITVMTVGFTLLLLSGLLTGTTSDPSGLLVLVVIIALSVGGTVLMYLPAASRFFASPRR